MLKQLQLKYHSDFLQIRSKGSHLSHQQWLPQALIPPTIIIQTLKTPMLLILRKNSFLMVSPSKKDNMLAKMPKIKSKELIILRCLLLSNPMQKVVETRCHFSLMEASYQTTFKLQRKKQTCLKNKPRNLVWPLRLKKIIIRKVICRPKQTLASRMRFPRARPFRLRRYKFNRSLYSQLR